LIPIAITLDETSDAATHFRTALASFAGRVTTRFATGPTLAGALASAEIVATKRPTEAQIASAPKLRWLSSWAAGVERIATPAFVARGILLTNASGVHGPNIAEHVLAMMLMFARGMPRYVRAQETRVWQKPDDLLEDTPLVFELGGATLAIVGLGRIGEALAVRARAFGMRVLGVKRVPSRRHDADVAVDGVYGLADLRAVLAEADHVCIAMPLTRETRGLFDRERLAWMKPGAYLYDIARGEIVDERALVEALSSGRIAGAGLDVFEREPLPKESALWGLPNVIVTPHVAGLTPRYFERAAALFARNLDRYLRGEPLENVYDPAREY
jgi:D-2-hydroxyacid dehydrogenase (NADP+)